MRMGDKMPNKKNNAEIPFCSSVSFAFIYNSQGNGMSDILMIDPFKRN